MEPNRQVLGNITNVAVAKGPDAKYTEAFRKLYHFQHCHREFRSHYASKVDLDRVIDDFFRDLPDGFIDIFCHYTTSQNLSWDQITITPAQFVEVSRDLMKWLHLLGSQCDNIINSGERQNDMD